MCGIIGYVGNKSVAPILLEGLETLEYRGYDSAGLFVSGKQGGLIKEVGPIVKLKEKMSSEGKAFTGTGGIAHTRWATHGAPTEANAHPHYDASGQIYIVHNGIIENYQELREGMIAQGIKFYSETDTEVLAKLIGTQYQGDLKKAVSSALALVRGAYGIAVMHRDEPGVIVAARLGSPLVVGIGDGEHFVASDSSALLPHTKRVVYLNDGDIAVLRPESYQVLHKGELANRSVEELEGEASAVQKNGFDHFMIKEIMEGPQVVTDTMRGRLRSDGVKLGGLELKGDELKSLSRITIAACGSAYIAGAVGAEWLRKYAGIPVEVVLASEYRYRTNIHGKNEALLVITQSGETADTLAAVIEAKRHGLLTLGVVNVVGSSIARATDAGVYNHAGPEVAVASTKAFISQLVVMNMITVFLAQLRGVSSDQLQPLVKALSSLPEQIKTVHSMSADIKKAATFLQTRGNVLCIGRGALAYVADEAALKLKEVSYIHAEAYAAGELKHGPIALLDEEMAVLALVPRNTHYEKMISNLEEVRARRAPVLAVISQGDGAAAALADISISIPEVDETTESILIAVIAHMISYYVGVAKGSNVDRPKNLAKSVTVE